MSTQNDSSDDVFDELTGCSLESLFLEAIVGTFQSPDSSMESPDPNSAAELQRRREEQARKESERLRMVAQAAAQKLKRDKESLEAKRGTPFKFEFKEKDRLTSGANYDVWAIRMSGLLKESGLWPYVTGEIERPSVRRTPLFETQGDAEEVAPAIAEWELMDQRAQSAIRTGLAEAMVISTSAAGTSREIWETLRLVYHSHDMMSRMQASSKFYALRMKESEPVDQFVVQFRLLRLKLAQTGTILTEEDACMRFLSALPPSYASFVTSQNAVLRLAQQMAEATGQSISDIHILNLNELIGALM